MADRVRFVRQMPPKTWTVALTALGAFVAIVMAYSVGSARASVSRDLRMAQAQLDSLKPVVVEVEDLKRLKSVLDSKMEVVDRLVIGRMSWAKKLYEIASLMSRSDDITKNVWLTGLSLVDRREMEDRTEVKTDRDGKKTTVTTRVPVVYRVIELQGVLPVKVSTGMVSDMMRMMKEDTEFFKDFTKVQLDNIQDAPGASAGKSFKLSLYMKPKGARA